MTRVVFITGVSSGIGRALAEEYLDRGNAVYGLSRREPVGLNQKPDFQFKAADLARFDEIPEKIQQLLGKVEGLDLAILNAGVLGPVGDLAETPLPEMQRVLDVNLWANKALVDAIFGLGIPVRQIVAISSGAAAKGNRGWNAYSISKAALNMLIALYAAERPQTHFCALAPGIVDTAMQDQISSMPHDSRYPSLEMLRSAKGSPMMPKPREAAARLVEGMARALQQPSGAFLDINSLVKRA